jgi:hypothetical protein
MAGVGERHGVSERDVEVLEFVARFGVVPRDAVAIWAGTARSMTARRERRLREAGLVEVVKPLAGQKTFLIATKLGLALCGRGELSKARLSPANVRHFAATTRLAARKERAGAQLLSERELLAHERALGERDLSIRLPGGSHHRCDLVAIGKPPTAIEVELSPKGSARLDQIVAGWREAVCRGRFARVLYLCSVVALPYVERSLRRAEAGAQVDAKLLPSDCLGAAPELV